MEGLPIRAGLMLTIRVEVSTDNKTWQLASEIVHPYSPTTSFNKLDIIAIGNSL